MSNFEFVVESDGWDSLFSCSLPCRVDKYISTVCSDFSRSLFTKQAKNIAINSKSAKANSLVKEGDVITFSIEEQKPFKLEASKIKLDILYEDDNSLVVNKPASMVVHPDRAHHQGTLLNALLYNKQFYKAFYESIENIASVSNSGSETEDEEFTSQEVNTLRPGIVHRLDKDTSGVILTAKNPIAQSYYSSLFKDRRVKKIYLAITKGVPPKESGTIATKLARSRQNRIKFASSSSPQAKQAITHYKTISTSGEFSLLAVKIDTGRTHQIRVHLSENGLPIIGDPLYARADSRFKDCNLMLHSYSLTFMPYKTESLVNVIAPIPDYFEKMILTLSLNFDPDRRDYFD